MANKVRDALIGAWRMVDWQLIDGDRHDNFLPPLGYSADCGGILLYTAEGLMSAMLSRKQRAAFKDLSLDGGTAEEKVGAFDSFVSYAGTYEVDEASAQVTHIVELASLPSFVGQRMNRICIFNGDRLKLDTPSMIIGGVSRASYIEWQRCKSLTDALSGRRV